MEQADNLADLGVAAQSETAPMSTADRPAETQPAADVDTDAGVARPANDGEAEFLEYMSEPTATDGDEFLEYAPVPQKPAGAAARDKIERTSLPPGSQPQSPGIAPDGGEEVFLEYAKPPDPRVNAAIGFRTGKQPSTPTPPGGQAQRAAARPVGGTEEFLGFAPSRAATHAKPKKDPRGRKRILQCGSCVTKFAVYGNYARNVLCPRCRENLQVPAIVSNTARWVRRLAGLALLAALAPSATRGVKDVWPAASAWYRHWRKHRAPAATSVNKESPGDRSRTFSGERMTLDCGNGVKMELARIPAGTFIMGSPVTESGRGDDELQHQVTISKPFYLGIHPVAQAQYDAVAGRNPSSFTGQSGWPRCPVEGVSWNEAVEFCRLLSLKIGRKVRLPTEAEWEYACRAETTSAFFFGASISREQANFRNNYSATTPVGTFPANAWGLYDMHGNVWEWCMDWYGEYPKGNVTDPQGPRDGPSRILRGGAWSSDQLYCRSVRRTLLGHSRRLGRHLRVPRCTGLISRTKRFVRDINVAVKPGFSQTL